MKNTMLKGRRSGWAGVTIALIASFLCAVGVASAATFTWTAQTGSGARTWVGLTASSDGAKLAAQTNNGPIYTSTDSGVTWTEQPGAGSHSWTSIASSADGTVLAATMWNGNIYTSSDSGVTWVDQTLSGSKYWNSIAMSSDGTTMIAGAGYFTTDRVYVSTDSGVNWTQTNLPARYWLGVDSSSDGTTLVAAANGGYIYTSSDSGANWTEQTNSGSRDWADVAMSSDGTKIAGVVRDGHLYTSENSGVDWTDRADLGSQAWFAVDYSADGSTIIAGVGWNTPGYMYVSNDSGATWNAQTDAGSKQWFDVSVSSDGTKLAGVDANSGYIHTSNSSYFDGGSGTTLDPYEIRTCAELQAMGVGRGLSYELTSDLDCSETSSWNSGAGFIPVGADSSHPFFGTFDGNGYTISNLTINSGAPFAGLFGAAENATIQDVTITNATITGTDYSAPLAGYVSEGTISNVIISGGTVTGETSTGGLAGGVIAATITGSRSSATVTGTSSVGGFVGGSQCASTFTNDYATGNVTGAEHVGGFVGGDGCVGPGSTFSKTFASGTVVATDTSVGGFGGTLGASTVTNAYASGDVSGNDQAGGFVGYLFGGTLTNTYARGTVTSAGSFDGLVGSADNDPTVINSFYDEGITSGGDGNPGTPASTVNMKKVSLFAEADWDFGAVWNRKDATNNGYPYFRYQYSEGNASPVLEAVTPIPALTTIDHAIYYYSLSDSADTDEVKDSGVYITESPTCANCEVIIDSDAHTVSFINLQVSDQVSFGFTYRIGSVESNRLNVGPFTVIQTRTGSVFGGSSFYNPIPQTHLPQKALLSAASTESGTKPMLPSRTLKIGMMGDDVLALQKRLNELGFLISKTGAGAPGFETRFFGPKTRQAIITFQKSKGLAADGVVGTKTTTALK